MFRPREFSTHFLEASEIAAAEATHVQELNELKSSLEQNFDQEFGKDAFYKYYVGKIQKLVHEDYEYVGEGDEVVIIAKAPTLKSTDYKIHFPHEDIADELGVNFVSLHGSLFKPYFMTAALHQLTGNELYDELAGDLLEDIELSLKDNIREGSDPKTGKEYGPLTPSETQFILDELSKAIDCLVAHRRPDSLRISDITGYDESGNIILQHP